MKDTFGVPLEVGDRVLSASTIGGRVKIGTLIQGKNGFLMTIDRSASRGVLEEKPQKTGQLGINVVVLQKADRTIPVHIVEAFDERH